MAQIIEQLKSDFSSIPIEILNSCRNDSSSCLFLCTTFLIRENPGELLRFLHFWHDFTKENNSTCSSPFNIRNGQGVSYFDHCIELYCKNQQVWEASILPFEESVLKYLISTGCDPTAVDSEINDSLKISLIKNRSLSIVKFVYNECYKIDELILSRRNTYNALPIRVALRYHRDPLDIIEFFIKNGSPVDNLDEMGSNLLHGLHGHLLHTRGNVAKRHRYFELYRKFNHLKNSPKKDGMLPIHSLFSPGEFGYADEDVASMDILFDLLMPANAKATDVNGETILMAFLSRREWFNHRRFQRLLDAGADATVDGTLARAIVSGGVNLGNKMSVVESAGAVFSVTDVKVFFDHIYSEPQSIRESSLKVFRDKLWTLPVTKELAETIPDVAIRLASVYLVIFRQPPPFDLTVKLVDEFGVDLNHVQFHENYSDTNTLLLELLSPFRRLDSEEALCNFLTQLINRYPYIDLDKADYGAEFELPYQIALTREAFVSSAILVKNFAKISNSLPRNLFVSKANDFAYFIKTIVAAGMERNAAVRTVANAQMINGQRRSQLIEWIVEFTTHRVKSLVEIVSLHFRRTRDRQGMLQVVNYLPWTERTMKIFYLDHVHD